MDKGFFARLFDFSFSEFITPSLIKVLYAISLLLIGLVGLIWIIGTLATGGGALEILMIIILAPILMFVYVILARVWLELIMVAFSIKGLLEEINNSKIIEPDRTTPAT